MADRTETISPLFNLPPGLSNLKYTVEDEFGGEWENNVVPNEELIEGDVWLDDDDGGGGLPDTPDYIIVASQTVRTLPGGGQVVDVILDLPDLDTGERYDIRVTTR